VARRYYWPKLYKDVRRFVAACPTCQHSKANTHPMPNIFSPLPTPADIFTDIAMDFFSGLPDIDGLNRVWIIVDRFSKLVLLIPTSTTLTAAGAAQTLLDKYCHRFGFPRSITSDRDPIFTSQLWTELNRICRTELKMSTVAHPATDGISEKAVSTVRNLIRAATVQNATATWLSVLPQVEFAINTTPHNVTGISPFYSCYLRNPRTINDFAHSIPSSITPSTHDLLSRLYVTHQHLTDAINDNRASMTENHDPATIPLPLAPDDLVLVHRDVMFSAEERDRTPHAKLQRTYIGPFSIRRQTSPNTYQLILPRSIRSHDVINVKNLRRFEHDSPDHDFQQPPLFYDEQGVYYFADRIIDHRKDHGKLRYRIRWLSPPTEDTWEPAAYLEALPLLISDYYRNLGN
jgi:hypothetical protein